MVQFDHGSNGSKLTSLVDVAPRADGGTWQLPLLEVIGKEPGPTLLVLAGVHGDEYAGIEAIPQIFRSIEPSEMCGRLTMIPVCNIAAYGTATRNSPIDGLNMARVFPGNKRGKLTEQIAFHITENYISSADFLIDLHTGGTHYELPTLVGYFHDQSEVGQRSLVAAHVFGVPVLWGHPAPIPPGRSISAALTRGIPWLYTESREDPAFRAENVHLYASGVFNILKHLKMLPGVVRPGRLTHHLVGDGNLDQVITAPTAGYFVREVELLDQVSAGKRLGTLRDLFGNVTHELIAEHEGVVIMLTTTPRVHPGDSLAQVTGRA